MLLNHVQLSSLVSFLGKRNPFHVRKQGIQRMCCVYMNHGVLYTSTSNILIIHHAHAESVSRVRDTFRDQCIYACRDHDR